ncbi:hypothetical protein O2K51_04070 [Apibacter raozihei]|uniref:hypothetical protein n=1 Tax=Apibacter raozihei TaxID=2500547 RepID=UPI000FE3BA64|nr:hypothetical protein [Apibacter raozihei]
MIKAVLGTKKSFSCVYKVCLRVSEQNLTYKIFFNYSGSIVNIQVKDFLLNGELPDALADQLALQCGEVLYPLEVTLSDKGSLYKLHNYTLLKNRWNSVKNKLFRYYSDSYSQEYLYKTDSHYHTEEKLFRQLKNNPIFFLYFVEPYRAGIPENKYKEYIQKYKGVDFDFIQWIEEEKEREFYHLYKEGIYPDRKEKMELSYKISSAQHIIEKACFTFFKNEQAIQQLTLERDSELSDVTLVEKEKIIEKKSLGFWMDEKQETS